MMCITEHQARQTTMMLPNTINMLGYGELRDLSRGCSSSFALSRYDENPSSIGTKTDQTSAVWRTLRILRRIRSIAELYPVRTIEYEELDMT